MSFSKSKLDADLDQAFTELDREGFWSKFDAIAFPLGKKSNPKQVKVAASSLPRFTVTYPNLPELSQEDIDRALGDDLHGDKEDCY